MRPARHSSISSTVRQRKTHGLPQQRVPLPLTNGSFITVNQIGDYYVGEKITITGQTNLAADDEILVQVYSSSFKPTQKSQSGEFSGATGTIRASSSSSSSTASSDSPVAPPAEAGRKYSTTNVQVKDVDEADIVKTDGTYVYVVTGNHLHILKGYPATSAGIIATLQFSGTPESLYVNGDRLVLISSTGKQDDFRQCQPGACSYTIPSSQKTQVFVYSVKDPAHPGTRSRNGTGRVVQRQPHDRVNALFRREQLP